MNEKLVTPICTAKYLWIFQPNIKFDPVGDYSITCVMEGNQAWSNLKKILESRLKEYYDTSCKLSKKKLKLCPHLPWKVDEKSGEHWFVAKNKAQGTKKDGTTFETKPRVVGPDPNIEIKEDDLEGKLGSGTQVRVGFCVNLWQNDAQGVGISARLSMVQIIKPVFYDPLGSYVDPEADEGSGSGFTTIPSDWFKPKEVKAQTKPKEVKDDIKLDPEFVKEMEGTDIGY